MVWLRLSLFAFAMLCTACVSEREIHTYAQPDQATLSKLASETLAYAVVETRDGLRHSGPSLMVFDDGVCVTPAHPCVEADRIETLRIGRDEMAVRPGAGLLLLAFGAAYSSQQDAPRGARVDFGDSPRAWVESQSSRTGTQGPMRIASARYLSRQVDDPGFPCGWTNFSSSNPTIEDDADAAEYLYSAQNGLSGSCLLATTDLIARYKPDNALRYWMLGATRVRWERLQCQNASNYQNSFEHLPDFEATNLEVSTVYDFGRVHPIGFLYWSRLSVEKAQQIMGSSLQAVEDVFLEMTADEATFDYRPRLDIVCARSGGVAAPEVRKSRQHFLRQASPSSDADITLFTGADIVTGFPQIEQYLDQIEGET